MKRKMNSLDVDSSAHPVMTRSRFPSGDNDGTSTSQADTWQASSKLRQHVMDLLSTKVSPVVLQSYKNKLEILSKSSFYIQMTCQDPPQPGESYVSNSALLHFIDPFRYQRMKRFGKSHVEVQLALLEELYDELGRVRDELEAFLDGKDPLIEEAAVQDKITSLLQAASDFESVIIPGQLDLKHQLISATEGHKVPHIKTALSVKLPVVFNKTLTKVYSDSVVLHWYIEGQQQHEPGEQFELKYKLLQSVNQEEVTQGSTTICTSYCLKITHLMPKRRYEFTIKRVDYDDLVCALWTESIILSTD
ncbi:fibronectin type III domain-containing protein 11-like [Trichomycterus rosablanca]|uniref:fibronectin type III domain-containing protein 11-like n=1 Tax=Trichomycterus rosablanca TaxID=2290929 RepID=UPI002F35BEA8